MPPNPFRAHLFSAALAFAACGPESPEELESSAAAELSSPVDQVFPNEVAGVYTPRTLLGTQVLTLPVTAPGQVFALQASITLANCTTRQVDACEDSLWIKCWADTPRVGKPIGPTVVAAENYPAFSTDRRLTARMLYISQSSAPVHCQPEFYNEKHSSKPGVDGTITVRKGATFTASGPLANTATSPLGGGAVHLTASRPTAALKPVSGWRGTTGSVSYTADFQATECHVPYPNGATDTSKYCTRIEGGADTKLSSTAVAIELYPDGGTCHVTPGTAVTTTISKLQHHKMVYTAVNANHTPGCANLWRFDVYSRLLRGRSVMINNAPYGQGQVRPR